jgi:hypothetical protein
MDLLKITRLFLTVLFVVACTPATQAAMFPPPSLELPEIATATVRNPASPTPQPHEPEQPEEAIQILEPGPGSRLVNLIHASGIADSTFEQNLAVRVVLDDGSVLASTSTTIRAEAGTRGPFEVDLPVDVISERQAFIQVYASSPRDGGITHLASVGVVLANSGTAEIKPVTPQSERIAIYQPVVNEVLSGAVHVEGYAWASFEQTLVVEVFDTDGRVVGSLPVLVNSPEMGQPGPFSADLLFTVDASGPGRVVVRDPSPAFDGDVHLASVEVTLQP